jgi:hypothetical protein
VEDQHVDRPALAVGHQQALDQLHAHRRAEQQREAGDHAPARPAGQLRREQAERGGHEQAGDDSGDQPVAGEPVERHPVLTDPFEAFVQ